MNNKILSNMKSFIIPSIDLLDGKIVRLYKGDYNQKVIYPMSIQELANKYNKFKQIHVVDLNGAQSNTFSNLELLKEIKSFYNGQIQFGGGLKSMDSVNTILETGLVDQIVLGTLAIENFELTLEILKKYTAEKVILALDCKLENNNYLLHSNGWKSNSSISLFELIQKYEKYIKKILVTDINVDGTLKGPNFELYKKLKQNFPHLLLQASGGVSCIEDINQLTSISDYAIAGKAFYEKDLDLYVN